MENNANGVQQQILEKLGAAKNILVTVSNNPNIDQLAACLGLTIWLNKIGKHATAVFSGEVPSTLDFLQPSETLEKNTDSLRDFIISLDKTKADKLRYKVEENVVKIFITPYRTSLSADDLEFGQGDFNVDMVVALGVISQSDLDQAITAHGRILHDATVSTITIGDAPSDLGALNWHDATASSLSELVTELGNGLDKSQLDNQIATALLTGIVSETERFSNNKTTPQTMSISAQLLAAGADQQLVATQLETPAAPTVAPASESVDSGDAVDIAHSDFDPTTLPTVDETAAPAPEVPASEPAPDVVPSTLPTLTPEPPVAPSEAPVSESAPTEFTQPETTPTDDQPMLSAHHNKVIQPLDDAPDAASGSAPAPESAAPPASFMPPDTPDVQPPAGPALPPVAALNANTLHLDEPGTEVVTDASGAVQAETTTFDPSAFEVAGDKERENDALAESLNLPTMPLPNSPLPPVQPPAEAGTDPNAPPAVPPPLPPVV